MSKSSITVWESLYRQGQSILLYPDSHFVSLAHRWLDSSRYPKVLDYSFGSGANLLFLLKRGFKVWGVEVADSAIEFVGQRLKKEHLSAHLQPFKGGALPFEDNTFDAVIAWQVLDYNNSWESLKAAVKEIDRVLRPGGKFIGTFTAAQDGLCHSAKKLRPCFYQIKAGPQKGVVKMAVDKRELNKCFPSRKMGIGKSGFEFNNIQSWYWIVTYEK